MVVAQKHLIISLVLNEIIKNFVSIVLFFSIKYADKILQLIRLNAFYTVCVI